jgi:hypothetical protein
MRTSRIHTYIRVAAAAFGLTAFIAASPVGSAAADPSTGRIRVLDCGSAGSLAVELGPAEFVTTTTAAIHVIGSNVTLQPRQVTVTFPDGSSIVTLDKSKASDVTCTYTDPAGLFIRIGGTLSAG